MQEPAIRIAGELGFFTVVVDGNSAAPFAAAADKFECIDLKDKEGIESFARAVREKEGLSGIMTAGTDFSSTVAWVAEKLELPGIPYETALNASDKGRMRTCFKKAGLPSPEFVTLTNAETVSLDRALPFGFPLVVKPVDNMGGRGCRRVNNREEWGEAAAEAIRFSRSGKAIAEAFMEGPEFSVDAIVYNGEITICGLADRHIFFPPFFIETGHTMPTAFPPDQQKAILETFCAGVRALGLADPENAGAAKGDIKLTPSGPMIGEIAARLSGGYMSGWTYPYSSGVEPIRAAILIAAGRKPDGLVPVKNGTSAERAFISIPGTVKSITGCESARNSPHVQNLFLRAEEGGKVSFPVNNVTKCGNIISAAGDRAAAVEAAENAVRAVLIRLDPNDDETASFLEGGEKSSLPLSEFPPDAFPVGPELRAALARLPETTPPVSSPFPAPRSLFPFAEFSASGLTDYAGRTIEESLHAVRKLTGLSLSETTQKSDESSDNKYSFWGKSFWAAFIRGGYQGAVYYIDRLEKK